MTLEINAHGLLESADYQRPGTQKDIRKHGQRIISRLLKWGSWKPSELA